LDSLLTASRIEWHLRLRAPVVQPSFVRLAARLAPAQAPLHCAPQYNTNRSAAFVCPFRVSARSSLPTRTGHTKAAPSHRAGHRRGKLRAWSAVCSAVRTICPVPPDVGPVQIAALPHSHLSMRSAIQTGARCSIRPVRGAYRADLAPVGFNTAPSQCAGDRRSNRYATPCHGTCFKRPGSTPRLRFAASGLSMDTLLTPALQRAVRIAAYCSNRHSEASASRSRPHRIGRFRRRAILRRFVPHPRKMANMRRLVLAKASHPRPNRWGRLVPPRRHPPSVFRFPQTRRPPVPFKRQELAYGSKPPYGGRYWRAARCVPGTVIGPGSKFRPDRCRRLLRPLRRVTPLASLARQLFRRAHRSTGS
jgi:hypothetical protein